MCSPWLREFERGSHGMLGVEQAQRVFDDDSWRILRSWRSSRLRGVRLRLVRVGVVELVIRV